MLEIFAILPVIFIGSGLFYLIRKRNKKRELAAEKQLEHFNKVMAKGLQRLHAPEIDEQVLESSNSELPVKSSIET